MNQFSDDEPTKTSRTLRPGELRFGQGLVAVIGSVVFIHFAMGLVLAVPMAVAAMVLLLVGVIEARDSSAPAGRQCAGIVLLLLGMAVLLVVSFMAASVSLHLALSAQHPEHATRYTGSLPGAGEYLRLGGGWLIAPLLMGPGLAFWTNWRPRRRFGWCLFLFVVPLLALLAHQILAKLGGSLGA
jgi:hypothetical protein